MSQNEVTPPTERTHRLSAHDERALAVAALVDPRTVRKALVGLRVSPMALARIRAALEAQGLAHILPNETAPA